MVQTLEMAAVFAELMEQLDHSQSVRAGADEFRRKAHQRSDGDDSVGEPERADEGHVLFLYGLVHNKVSNTSVGAAARRGVEVVKSSPRKLVLGVNHRRGGCSYLLCLTIGDFDEAVPQRIAGAHGGRDRSRRHGRHAGNFPQRL